MMKNIFFIITLILLFSTGCSDFLDEINKSDAVAEEFYLTKEGYNALINANYADLRNIYGDQPWLFAAGTDMYSEGRNQEPLGLSQYSQLDPTSQGVSHLYNTCYDAIQKANAAIFYASSTESRDDIDELLGEIKFLRAHAYFLLVQTYGGVPLITEFIDEAVTEFDRNSAEEIYNQIILDLNDALNNVDTGIFSGRVNQRAVQHLLAKVYLTRAYESFGSSNDFTEAAKFADAAIGGQRLVIPFAELWAPGNEMNDETIFSVQFDPSSVTADVLNLGNRQQNFFGSETGGPDFAGIATYKTYTLCPNRYTLSLFEENDERWEATFMVEIYERYLDFFDVDDKSGLTVAHFYAPRWFTEADSLAYIAEHPDLGTYHAFGTYDPEGVFSPANYETIIVKKFDDPEAPFAATGVNGRTSRRDFIVSRLGETYLLAAEAYLELGNTATALDRLNEVRARAGVDDVGTIDIDVILDERARELLGEYHRWFDLKRTGKLVERASKHHMLIGESNFVGKNGELKILRPIPQSALDLNRNQDFQQNPAYN